MFRSQDVDAAKWHLLVLLFALTLVVAPLAACSGTAGDGDGGALAEHDGGNEDEAPNAEGTEHAGADAEHEGEAEAGHVHPAGEDIPSRTDEEARDEYSKPLEVYDFVGIEEGFTVVDVGAGSGYNTYLLSARVGPQGHVYAERGNEGLAARLDRGDLGGASNVTIVDSLGAVPDGVADAVILVREYHLVPDYEGLLAELSRVLRAGGVVGVVEVRSNQPTGHDMPTHRMGEETVIEQFAGGGFEYVGASEVLRRDDDDYTAYGGPNNVRYMTDRMLLSFRKPQ